MVAHDSKLYSHLWSSSNKLRGPLDANIFKDYVLVLLFLKYASDRQADVAGSPIVIPPGASFQDLVALKGRSDLGDRINEQIIAPLVAANRLFELPDFNDAAKLGVGREMVDRLSGMISILEHHTLDFSPARSANDDLLGLAYEYFLRRSANESGKNRVPSYTPREVSRVMAQVLLGDDRSAGGVPDRATAYDPTFAFGSPLLQLSLEAKHRLALFGQAREPASRALAELELRLHGCPQATIALGNSLTDPQFKDGDQLKTFDFVVADPPFHEDGWSFGFDPMLDPFKRFQPFGAPPVNRGSYAYLLHVLQSLKSSGRGACILPQRALSRGRRGDVEADIRWALVRKGLITGIIALPPNVFLGTRIATCIVVVDKRDANARRGIFMIDAGSGYVKEGLKNRLRLQDIDKIVDVFHHRLEIPRYSRLVPFQEIASADFNLSVVPYLDIRESLGQTSGDRTKQRGTPSIDIEAHRCRTAGYSLLEHAALLNHVELPPEAAS